MSRVWNVVAALTVVLLLAYSGMAGYALVIGKTDFTGFQQAVMPVITAVVGYLAAFLPKQDP